MCIFHRHSRTTCPVCHGADAPKFTEVDGVPYYNCRKCDCIFADPEVLRKIDSGVAIRQYDASYWQAELASARQRSYGPALARVAEACLYCRVPINRFVDIGTGPGYLLDALKYYLPSSTDRFFGVEAFPPPTDCSSHPNYVVGRLGELPGFFEAGSCIEVIEHLTPAMADDLARQIAEKSAPGALFIFNTGLVEYVRAEDPGYLDPLGRGHIMSWSIQALQLIFEPHGLKVLPIPGKTWAFCVERGPASVDVPDAIVDRIWSAHAANVEILNDVQTGSLMYVLGLDTVRAYR